MIWTLLTLLTWVVLGGFISYYGDLQGRRWGKKRVSWFGLRPKHTAILITSLTGGFIALLSIVTVLAIAPTVRDVVLRGESAINKNKSLLADLHQQVSQMREAQKQLSVITAKLEEVQPKLAAATHDLAAKQVQLANLKRNYALLSTQNQNLQSIKASLEMKNTHLSANISRLTADTKRIEQLNKNYGQANQSLGSQNYKLARQNEELGKSNTGLLATNQKLLAEQTTLIKDNANFGHQNETLKVSYNKLLDDIEEKSRLVASKEGEVNSLQEQVRKLIRQQEDLISKLAGNNRDFTQTYLTLREKKLNLHAGAELARHTLDAHERPEKVRRELLELLKEASNEALKYGAARGDNGREVQIVNKRVVTTVGDVEADEEASLAALVDNLAGSDTPTVVVANVFHNSLQGEQVLVELHLYRETTLFEKGNVVASRRIDTNQPLKRVVESLLQFLQKDVRDAAIKNGAIPRIDPETGALIVGRLEIPDMILLTEQVRQVRGPVMLSAVAKTKLASADPLDLEFKVTRLSDRK
jgi:uncharacterized protein (DUF3084 family)